MNRTCSARAQLPYAAEIVALASAYPDQVVTNEDYLNRVAFCPSDGWDTIAQQSGIRSRRWCRETENSATLMHAAIERLIKNHPDAVADVQAIVVASGTTAPIVLPISTKNPAMADLAPLALRQLRTSGALGLDIKSCYCTGFLRALEIADGLLANPHRTAVMVIAVEQGSKLATASSNRSSFSFMVGDAAGAAIVRRGPADGDGGLLDHVGFTDQEKLDWVGIGSDARSIIMMGSQAAEASFQLFVNCGKTLLERHHLTPGQDVSWLLPLQTHLGLVKRIAQALDWPEERVLWDASEVGFSGSSSIPACLADKVEQGIVRKGDRLLALAVGAGLNCAGTLLAV